MENSWIRKDKYNAKRVILIMTIAVIITVSLYTLKKYSIQIGEFSESENLYTSLKSWYNDIPKETQDKIIVAIVIIFIIIFSKIKRKFKKLKM